MGSPPVPEAQAVTDEAARSVGSETIEPSRIASRPEIQSENRRPGPITPSDWLRLTQPRQMAQTLKPEMH